MRSGSSAARGSTIRSGSRPARTARCGSRTTATTRSAGSRPAAQVTSFGGKGIRLPIGITQGPDEALWFTSNGSNSIGRITTGGELTLFRSTVTISRPRDITLGPDGALWFTNLGSLWFPKLHKNPIGRITAGGRLRSYPVKDFKGAFAITAGAGKTLWFTSSKAQQIGQITTGGAVTTHAVPTGPLGIAHGPTARSGSPTPGPTRSGGSRRAAISEATPTPASNSPTERSPQGPTARSGSRTGASDSIGRITTDGSIPVYTDPSIDRPQGITAGPDGALWFTNLIRAPLDRADHHRWQQSSIYTDPSIDGAVRDHRRARRCALVHERRHRTRSGASRPMASIKRLHRPRHWLRRSEITAGPDGALWFIELRWSDSIGRISTDGDIRSYSDRRHRRPGRDRGWARRRPLVHQDMRPRLDRADQHRRPHPQLHRPQHRARPAGSRRDRTAPSGSPTPTRSGGSRRRPRPQLHRPEASRSRYGITAGPDGALWFTNDRGHSIGRITTDGTVTIFDGTVTYPTPATVTTAAASTT